MSYNPLTGTITLRNIRPVGDEIPGKPTADAFEIIDWEQEGDLVTQTHIKIVNFRINVLEAARSENSAPPAVGSRDPPMKIFERPLQALIVLGYPHLVADAEVEFRYDLDEASMEFAVSLHVERMGKANLALALAGVKPNLVRAVREIGSQASMENPVAALAAVGALSALKKDLEQISLADFGLSYDESGLVRRLKQYHDIHTLRLPSEPSQLELSNEDIERIATLGVALGLPEDKVRSGARAVANFSKKPERLRLQTQMDGPVRLARLFGADHDAKGVGRLILLTNAEIAN